jgi:hypothetical protein
MRIALFLALLTACGKDANLDPDAPTGGDGPQVDADTSSISGTISSDQTWSGAVTIAGVTTIAAGVTVTVTAGTHITAKSTAVINVMGTIDIQGTTAAHVVMAPQTTGGVWGGFVVAGTMTEHYGDQTGGGISVQGGTVTVIDTLMWHLNDTRDFLVMDDGNVDVEYSVIAPATGTNDQIHCDMHTNAGGSLTVKIVHSNLSGALNAMDFYGGSGADLTYNNWFGNSVDVYTEASFHVTGDVSNGWFQQGAPTAASGSTLIKMNMSSTQLTDAGPRP